MSSSGVMVAIDGPAGAGKSTVSKILALRMGLTLVDTGAIYRCVAYEALRRGLPLDGGPKLSDMSQQLHIRFELRGDENRVFLNQEDVSLAIRASEVSMAASKVSQLPDLRAALLGLQRRLALESKRGAVLEGRDIGTVVFPDAQVKVFLFADSRVRAERRYEELYQRGQERPLAEVLAQQTQRDQQDEHRETAPLKPAPDAVLIDSTHLHLSQVVEKIEALIRPHLHP